MKKPTYELLQEVVNRLPDFCTNYLYRGQSEHSSLTILNYARDLEYFFQFAVDVLPYFPDSEVRNITVDDLKQITTNDINLYLTVMREKYNLADKTRARRKSAVSNLFNYLVNTERSLDFNPVSGASKVKIHSKDYVIYLNREEQQSLLNCVMYGTGLTNRQLAFHEKEWKRDLAIVFLFLDTGLRISELQSINVKDVDFIEHCVYIVRKGGKTQKIYHSDEAGEYIADYLSERPSAQGDDPLFLSARGERIAIRTIQAMLEKYVSASLPEKREQISPHKLRSSFAMEFYKGTRDILLLQQRMGHASIVATNIYAKASEKELIERSRNWRSESYDY